MLLAEAETRRHNCQVEIACLEDKISELQATVKQMWATNKVAPQLLKMQNSFQTKVSNDIKLLQQKLAKIEQEVGEKRSLLIKAKLKAESFNLLQKKQQAQKLQHEKKLETNQLDEAALQKYQWQKAQNLTAK